MKDRFGDRLAIMFAIALMAFFIVTYAPYVKV
jgi:hypothetical protein